MLFSNFFILVGLLFLFSCNKIETEPDVPAAIRNKIKKYKNDSIGSCLEKVSEYIYDGKEVYLFQQSCPDAPANLYSKFGKKLCSPWGGFFGVGDEKCTDFSESAEFKRVVWEDEG